MKHYGRTRPDLPDDCPEKFSPEFYLWIWRTRSKARANIMRLMDSVLAGKRAVCLRSQEDIADFLAEVATD